MAFISINDTAYIVTEVTTIFNGNLDKRCNALRADRKELSNAVTKFVVKRVALLAMKPEEHDEDMEVEARFIDVDKERVFLAMNVNAWVRSAQETLDVYNDYDRDMLGRVADYVERFIVITSSAAFFTTLNDKRRRNPIILTRDDIVPSRTDEEIEKRKRVEDSDESLRPS